MAYVILINACNGKDNSSVFSAIDVKYPVSVKDSLIVDDYFGIKVANPYRRLVNDTCLATSAWVKAENAVI